MKAPEAARELTDFQELVCDLAGDLIVNGGDGRDVQHLVTAVLRHYLRREGFKGANADSLVKRDRNKWNARLARQWPKHRNSATEPESEPEPPRTVSEMVRENLRGRLQDHFEGFLERARMHELYLLDGVLETFESATAGATNKDAESTLAEAFTYEIGADHTYVKVSRDRLEAVEEYIQRLEAVPVPDKDETDELTKLWNLDANIIPFRKEEREEGPEGGAA